MVPRTSETVIINGERSKSARRAHQPGCVKIAAFYHFSDIGSCGAEIAHIRERVLDTMTGSNIRGTVILASEGINATIAGAPDEVDQLLRFLRHDPVFEGCLAQLTPKISFAESMPFSKSMVKIKPEIVTMREPGVDPRTRVGQYIEPEDWNELIDDPDTVVIDTRNEFEIDIGTFVTADGREAVRPETSAFCEFPAFVQRNEASLKGKRIAMFCTGGIRCEKATAYLLEQGFENVFHLRGGILEYLDRVPGDRSRWRGECFVFDERVSVDHGLQPGRFTLCRGCRKPLSPEDRNRPEFEEGVSCHRCKNSRSDAELASLRERQKQVTLARARGERHLGPRNQGSRNQA